MLQRDGGRREDRRAAMTPVDLAALQALAEEATPGPWRYLQADNVFVASAQGALLKFQPRSVGVDITLDDRNANGSFIAAANPETVLWLLAEIARLRAERDAMQRRAEAAEDDWKAVEAERDMLRLRLDELYSLSEGAKP